MAAVMRRAIDVDEDASHAQQEHVSKLETENQGLRDLLLITNGHLGSRLLSRSTELSMTDHATGDTQASICDDINTDKAHT